MRHRFARALRPLLAGLALGIGAASAAPPPDRLSILDEPRSLPPVRFQNDAKEVLSLTDFQGKVVVLNVWATWCPPCREEMPTLDALQEALGGERFEVVALSLDRAGPAVVREFYQAIGIGHLRLYIDPSMRSMASLGVSGVPTTLVIGPSGQELGRLVGTADWASPEMVAYFRELIDQLQVQE